MGCGATNEPGGAAVASEAALRGTPRAVRVRVLCIGVSQALPLSAESAPSRTNTSHESWADTETAYRSAPRSARSPLQSVCSFSVLVLPDNGQPVSNKNASPRAQRPSRTSSDVAMRSVSSSDSGRTSRRGMTPHSSARR